MPHIEYFWHRLKMVWINKILDPLKIAPWKTLFIDQYNKYGADKIWMLDQYGLSKVASHFNRFWTVLLVVQSGLTKFFCRYIGTISYFFFTYSIFSQVITVIFFVSLILTFQICGIICKIPIYCKKVVSIP
jgi:hypothetical protein